MPPLIKPQAQFGEEALETHFMLVSLKSEPPGTQHIYPKKERKASSPVEPRLFFMIKTQQKYSGNRPRILDAQIPVFEIMMSAGKKDTQVTKHQTPIESSSRKVTSLKIFAPPSKIFVSRGVR